MMNEDQTKETKQMYEQEEIEREREEARRAIREKREILARLEEEKKNA